MIIQGVPYVLSISKAHKNLRNCRIECDLHNKTLQMVGHLVAKTNSKKIISVFFFCHKQSDTLKIQQFVNSL